MTKDPRQIPQHSAAASKGVPAQWTDRERAKRQNELLDEALQETFPASDPVSIVQLS